jgi:hypothetical protein
MDRSCVEFQETSEQHTNELEPYESTVEETSLKTVIHNTNDQLTQNSNSTDHSTPITIMHETEIKSTRSQSATIVHNQVDASKLNKKSSKCVKTKSDKEDIIVNQKTRILNLENEIKQLKKVVDTYTRTLAPMLPPREKIQMEFSQQHITILTINLINQQQCRIYWSIG